MKNLRIPLLPVCADALWANQCSFILFLKELLLTPLANNDTTNRKGDCLPVLKLRDNCRHVHRTSSQSQFPKKKGKLQITFGLICNGAGCPVAVEVFDGNTGDPTTFTPQIEKVRSRFGIKHVIWVGDRGMITQARIKQGLQPVEGLLWITTLRSEQIRALVEQEAIQLSLFDQQDLAEISCADYPDERLIACRNPLLAEQRKTKR